MTRFQVKSTHGGRDNTMEREKIFARLRPVLIGIILVVLCAAVFSATLSADFVAQDDDIHVYYNPFLNPVTAAHILHFWRTPYEQLYIPLSYTVFSMLALLARLPAPTRQSDGDIISLNPHIFHMADLALHLCNVILVFVLLRRLLPADKAHRDWAAAAGALLFGIHPVQVESVAWVSELRGLLAAFFSLLALWVYVGFARAGRKAAYILASLCFGLALISKPTAAAVPLIAWTLEYWILQRPWCASAKALIPWLALTVVFLLLTRGVQPVPVGTVGPLWTRPFIAGDALAFYLSKLLWPVNLCFDYGQTPTFVLRHWWGYVNWLVPVTLGVGVWLMRRRAPWLAATAMILIAAVLPVLGFVPFLYQTFSTVADRYLYLALLGPALGLAFLLSQFGRKVAAWGVCAVLLLMLGFQSSVQVVYWNNSFALFQHTLAINPNSYITYFNLGVMDGQTGHKDLEMGLYREALRLNPACMQAHENLGADLAEAGKTAEAIAEFQQAVRLAPNEPLARYDLASVLSTRGDLAGAIAQYREALRINPKLTPAKVGLEQALRKQASFGAAALLTGN